MVTAQRELVAGMPLLDRLGVARRQSDALFDIVRQGAIFDRPIPERHRIVFYIGHLEAFDWNLLHENALGLKTFHAEFDRLFAFGIDPVGGGLPTDQPSDWPSLDQVREYVRTIRASLDERLLALESFNEHQRDGFSLETLLNVAIEHRLMHVETLAYMFHQLPVSSKVRPPLPPRILSSPVEHSMIKISSGTATLGLPRQGAEFGWDNEFEKHTKSVREFQIDRYMVTNQQFLDFIEDGGYRNRGLWSDRGWEWKAAADVSSPVFWVKRDGQWMYRTMFDETPLPLDWPVYVSHAEASAFARWTDRELPTEAQWHRAAYGTDGASGREYPWGNEAPTPQRGNFDLQSWDPTPVNAHPQGRSAFGVEGMLGNGWEWTSTVFGPFPGFEPFPFYRGYSADFFDGKHFVMKGGSARTAACMLRSTFRNWFQSHYQYVYAGFRCVNTSEE
jgi:gamma-glutamyl hercynylcysteine S-oxide synthase